MSTSHDWWRGRPAAAVWAALLIVGCSLVGSTAAEPEALDFLWVYVPADRLSEVPLGTGRYVPMTLAEFRAAVADRAAGSDPFGERPGSSPAMNVIAENARYTLEWSPAEGLRGTAAVTLGPGIDGLRRAIPLAGRVVPQASLSSDAGTGAAEIAGLPDGSVAVIADTEGRYSWQFELPTDAGGSLGPAFRLPVVPAVFSSVQLTLPAGFVPLVKGAEAVQAAPAPAPLSSAAEEAGTAEPVWTLSFGPTSELVVTIAREPLPDVPISCWSRLAIERQTASLATTLQPAMPWTKTDVRLRVPPGLTVVAAKLIDEQGTTSLSWRRSASASDTAATDASAGDEADELVVQLPTRAIGTRPQLVIESIAAIGIGKPWTLPAILPPDGLWAGGGMVAELDPRLVVERVEPVEYLPVDEEIVKGWPMALDVEAAAGPRLAFEAQAPTASLSLTVAPRKPDVQVQRVTTVDISAGSVIAQAACEISVERGELFELTGQVAPGWLIDSVEIPGRAERADWRVEAAAEGSRLRVGLVSGVSRGSTVRVNVMGHRGPLREGEPFARSSLEMLKLSNEQAAALEIRTNAEMTIDGAGQTVDSVPLDQLPPGLRKLAGDSGVRLRLLVRDGDDRRTLRLLRRRPPIDVQTQVRLTVRDDRLTESFTLECSPRDAELDSVVVHFSEPTGDGMEWTLLPPTTGQLLARRLQPQEPRDPAQAMESWLLELVPPARGPVTLRGVQTVPFTGPVNVPLAWVEGAASPVGELQIRDAGRRRPLVVNRSLSEVPGVAGDTERYATSVSRFLFDPLRDLAGGQAAARLVPGGDDGVAPRAWAWNETTTCWCHTSGVIEYETVFDIENHGRSSIILSHPTDKRIQEILVDGVQLVAGVRETLGGETVIELPAGRRMVRLEIHALASARPLIPRWGQAWSVDPIAGVIDLPVLERLWQLGLPPGLRIAHVPALHQQLEQAQVGWLERLLGSSTKGSPASGFMPGSAAADSAAVVVDGFRLHAFAPTSGRSMLAGVVLVSSWLVVSSSLIAGLVAAVATWFLSRRAPAVAVAICGLAAVAALWAPVSVVAIVRAAWWGGLIGMALAVAGGRTATVLMVFLAAGCSGGSLTAAETAAEPSAPLRVFFTGETADATVLVPDRLFRELGRNVDATEGLGVRIERVTVAATVPAFTAMGPAFTAMGPAATAIGQPPLAGGLDAEPGTALADADEWQVTVDLSSDANTVCTLRQPVGGGRFVRGSLELDGGTTGELPGESISADGSILRVPLAVPGRHRLSVRLQPAVRVEGGVGLAMVGLPVAPQATLRIVETDAGIDVSSLLVERERNGLPIASATSLSEATGSGFDIAQADLLRLCWSVEPAVKLVQNPRVVAARNDVSWDALGCAVVASFQLEPNDGIFRSFVVTADPRLTPAVSELPAGSEPVTVRRIDDGRWLVERLQPARGRATVSVPFAMPLADPVGVFRVPEVEIASSSSTQSPRAVQFVPGEGYAATVRLPAGVTAGSPTDPSSSNGWLAWRREPSSAATAAASPVVVSVSRVPAVLRGTQRMRLDVVDGRLRLRFDASVDSVEAALATFRVMIPPHWTVDRMGLARVTAPRTGALQASPQDIHWTRVDEETLEVLCQRPRSGRFRFDLEAREPRGSAEMGSVAVPWIAGLGDTPVIVEWPTDEGVEIESAGDTPIVSLSSSAWQSLELLSGSPLAYRRRPEEASGAALAADDGQDSDAESRAAEPGPAGAEEGEEIPRVELLDVRFATDDRGKAWGVARIDLVPSSRLVRLQLPAGMRLFEVFVDEHPLRARPAGEAAWELELLDVSRPRTILVIFAGDIDDQLVSGRPLRLEPPTLPGVPTRKVTWMIRGPRGLDMRILAPSAQVSADEVATLREEASLRLKASLRRSLEGRDARERARIEEEVASLLERSQQSAAEQAWNRTSLALSADVFATTTDPEGGVVIRAAAKPTPTDSSRAVATAAAILVAGAAWSMAIRRPSRLTGLLAQFGPLGLLALGGVWAAFLQPAWPGGLLLVGGVVSLVRRLIPPASKPAGAETALVIRDSVGQGGG